MRGTKCYGNSEGRSFQGKGTKKAYVEDVMCLCCLLAEF